MAFETKIYGNKVRMRGIVDNVTNQQTHYGRMYRIIRSVFFNEPFQFAKGGKNKFAETSCYCILRVSDPDFICGSRQVICYNDLVNSQISVGDEVEIIATQKRLSGTYIGNKIYDVNSGVCINAKSFTVSPHIIRIFFALIIASLIFIGYSVAEFFSSGEFIQLLVALIPIVIMIIGFAIMFSPLFPNRRRRRHNRYNERWW